MLRWLEQEEFADGERVNPYPADVPAARIPLKAVPEAQYYWLPLGLDPYLISAAVRRLRALPGEVWIPDEAFARRSRYRLAVLWLLVLDAGVGLLAAGAENNAALLVWLALTLVALPVAVRALRGPGSSGWRTAPRGRAGTE